MWLRRHLDSNGDGVLSGHELQAALHAMGVQPDSTAAAADELLGLAGRGPEAQGATFGDFLAFVKRVRLQPSYIQMGHLLNPALTCASRILPLSKSPYTAALGCG